MFHRMQLRSLRRLTLDHVWLTAFIVLFVLCPLLTPIQPVDFWWHVATGRVIVTTGVIPTVDSFSYTRTNIPFYDQEWLAEISMYVFYQFGGAELTLIVQSLIIVLAYGLLLRLCIVRTGRINLSVAILLLLFPLGYTNWSVRPQSYAFPIFVSFLTVLTEDRLGRSHRLWLLPLLMIVWVNTHGSFMLGLALIGLTFTGELLKAVVGYIQRQRADRGPQATTDQTDRLDWQQCINYNKRLLIWGTCTALVVLINPHGFAVLSYVRNLLSNSVVTNNISEWAPPTIRDTHGMILFLFVIGFGALFLYTRQRPDLTDMLLFGAFLLFALDAVRNIVWFGFVAAMFVAVQTASLLPPATNQRQRGSPTLNALLIGMLGLLIIIGLPWVKPRLLPSRFAALLDPTTPVQAVAAIRQLPDPPQHLFHAMGYGSYLMWALPEQKVFADPRIELYPSDQWRDYMYLRLGVNVPELLDTYHIDGVLLSKSEQAPLIQKLRTELSSSWEIRYEDRETVYMTRRM